MADIYPPGLVDETAEAIKRKLTAPYREGTRNLATELHRLERYLAERRAASRTGYVDMASVVKVTEDSLADLAAKAKALVGRDPR